MWSEWSKKNCCRQRPKWCWNKPPQIFPAAAIITHPLFAVFSPFSQDRQVLNKLLLNNFVSAPVFPFPFSAIRSFPFGMKKCSVSSGTEKLTVLVTPPLWPPRFKPSDLVPQSTHLSGFPPLRVELPK